MHHSRLAFAFGSFAPALFLATFAVGCSDAASETDGMAEDGTDSPSDDVASAGTLDPTLFRPAAAWTGRLELPKANERRPDGAVRIEVHNTPNARFRNRKVWLKFSRRPDVATWAKTLTRDLTFSKEALESAGKGNVHPFRLADVRPDGTRVGWKQVSPLESLAGARPADDVLVALKNVEIEGDELVIDQEPMQIPGDMVALARVERPVDANAGLYRVRHYNKVSRNFDGPARDVVFEAPPLPIGQTGVKLSPVEGIEQSLVNWSGFYLYGASGTDGRFRVRALEPRQTRQVPPTDMRVGETESRTFATSGAWFETPKRKGSARNTLLTPASVTTRQAALAWANTNLREGNELLVLHLFGGIGPHEKSVVVTGHFSFGIGRIVREPLADELQLDIEYKQVYAHNPNGIISGSTHWAEYSGSFSRGWMYTRPIGDTAFFLPALTRTYDIAGLKFRPIDALAREFEAMGARYRIGNGTGASIVTPANSCIQDSSQALFLALMKLESAVQANPAVARFVQANPNDPQVRDFKALSDLASEVEQYLSPLGVRRADWQRNAENVAAVTACEGSRVGQVACALGSYKTILPRIGNDNYARVLLKAGAGGVMIRTNQVPAKMPGIEPLAAGP